MSFARTRLSLCVLGPCSVVAGPKRCPSVPGSRLASPRPPDPAGAVFCLPPHLGSLLLQASRFRSCHPLQGWLGCGTSAAVPGTWGSSLSGSSSVTLSLSGRSITSGNGHTEPHLQGPPACRRCPSVFWMSSFWLHP